MSAPPPVAEPRPRAVVLSPALSVTVTIESAPVTDDPDRPEIHLHAGGQGYWIGRMLVELGADVTLVGPVGGEVGPTLATLVGSSGMTLKPVEVLAPNGAYVHDRRTGDREVVAEMPPAPLPRHDADELYGAVLVAGLDADVVVLAGPGIEPVVGPAFYRRLTTDLRANGVTVVADVSGAFTEAVVAGGVSVLKTSAEELGADGRVDDESPAADVGVAARGLVAGGAGAVVITRAEDGALVTDGSAVFTTRSPRVSAEDHRGAGDSFTAGVAFAVAQGLPLTEAARLGAAAGALNVTRRGLGSGSRHDIHELATRVELVPLDVTEREEHA